MNIKKRLERNKKIVDYLEGREDGQEHTFWEAALKFDLSMNQIFRIKKQFKQQSQEQPEGVINGMS